MKNSNRIPKYHSTFNFSTPYKEKQLPTSQLHSGNGYQRRINPRVIKKIVDEFDPKLLDDVVISFRDGRYNVVDGQHRIVALKILNGGADCIVNCKVIYGLTYEQEARLYRELDACKKRLSISDATRASAEAKDDPRILNIQKALALNGIDWAFSGVGRHGGPNRVVATRAILSAYSSLDYLSFLQMIRLIKKTWGGAANSLNMYMLSGMTLFVKTYGDEIDEKYFIKKLSKVPSEKIIAAGRSDISTSDMGLKYARAIWNRYNYKASKNALEYKFKG